MSRMESSIIQSLEDEVAVVSPRFDASFYRDGWDNNADGPADLVQHFCEVGWREGRDPAPWFSVERYLNWYPDVASAGQNPFVHYLTMGINENRICLCSLQGPGAHDLRVVAPEFDVSFYSSAYPDIVADNIDLLEHFCRIGWKEGRDPAVWFSTRRYLGANPSVRTTDINPFVHYLTKGRESGRIALPALACGLSGELARLQPEFDEHFYYAAYPDVAQQGIPAAEHYCVTGWSEGRDPTIWFSTKAYQQANPDVERSGLNPFLHYICEGRDEGRSLAPASTSVPARAELVDENIQAIEREFDKDYYLKTYDDIDATLVDPLLHFCLYGWKEGRNPAAWFDTKAYAKRHPDLAKDQINPFFHYLTTSRQEGAEAIPTAVTTFGGVDEVTVVGEEFDRDYYLNTYPDIGANNLDPLDHFCTFGWKEGRDPAPWFSVNYYRKFHKDVQGNPFFHYLTMGRAQKRRVWPAAADGPRNLILNKRASLVDRSLLDLMVYPPRDLATVGGRFDCKRLDIHWVIPDFSPGSGGHMTIFRVIRHLEMFGHKCSIWLHNPDQHKSAAEAADSIIKDFQVITAEVKLLDESFQHARGDIIIATSWHTVAAVGNARWFRERFYFVQDLESNFYSTGSYSLVIEESYRTCDFACVCASPWLAQVMRDKYHRWARAFSLAFDSTIYAPAVEGYQRQAGIPRIAVYSRVTTARRAVELAFVALQYLAHQGFEFHADLFGADLEHVEASFSCTSHGILEATQLAELYRQCDIGICFSATNYSLVPKEMMASGLAVVELDVESTRSIFPPEVVTFSGPSPLKVAEDIRLLLSDPLGRQAQAAKALNWVRQFSWESSSLTIEAAFLERLREKGHKETKQPTRRYVNQKAKATVCIPTFNGGSLLQSVVERVRSQSSPWPYEIVVVDSSSDDGSTDFLRGASDVIFRQIPQNQFGHGRTRNLCAELGAGQYVLFLTQDALPVDDSWLYNMVAIMERCPQAGGAFGRHLAWPDASPYTQRDLQNHFQGFLKYPLAVSKFTDPAKWSSGDTGWRQFLHFFSDNNSCLRRTVWEKIPYPDIEFGEDQVWANLIVEAGHERVYAPASVVYHSHDYASQAWEERSKTEALFFAREFGYDVFSGEPFEDQLRRSNMHDIAWGRSHGVEETVIERRMAENEARLRGARAAHLELTHARASRTPLANDTLALADMSIGR